MRTHAWGEELATAVVEAISPEASSGAAPRQGTESVAVRLPGELTDLVASPLPAV